MEKYEDGIRFIDSLKDSDFVYAYKKNMLSRNSQALIYGARKDSASRNLVYRQMTDDLEQYIKKPDINMDEFTEASTELFTIFKNYLDVDQINQRADSLKKSYPDKKDFFEGFKQ